MRTRGGKKDPKPGVALRAEPFTYSKLPLDDLRIPFYEQKTKELEKKEAERPVRPRD